MPRGLLCSDCNTALGLVKEAEPTLLRMVEYLQQYLTRNRGLHPQTESNQNALDGKKFDVSISQENLAVHPCPTPVADSTGCGF